MNILRLTRFQCKVSWLKQNTWKLPLTTFRYQKIPKSRSINERRDLNINVEEKYSVESFSLQNQQLDDKTLFNTQK